MPVNAVRPLAASVVALLIAAHAAAQPLDWNQWRGGLGNSAVEADAYPTALDPDAPTWVADLPGDGSSTPIVAGDAIVVTCVIDGDDALAAYTTNSEPLWTVRLGPARVAKHRAATGANPTAVFDGERIIAYYKSGRVAGVSSSGEELWQRNLQTEYGKDTLWWDLGTSPVLTPAGVLIAVMQAGESYLVTLDAATGETVWKVSRTYETSEESDQAYTTPFVVDTEAGPTVVVTGADRVTGHDPMTGAERFVFGSLNPQDTPMWRMIASASTDGTVAVVPYGRGEHLAALRLGGAGDTTATHKLWDVHGVGSDVPAPVIDGDRVLVLGDKGRVTAVNLATGETQWSDKLPRSRTKYYATPLLAGDLLYCINQAGVLHVARVGEDGIEVLSTADFEDDVVATPTPLADGGLLIRTRKRLYRFGPG